MNNALHRLVIAVGLFTILMTGASLVAQEQPEGPNVSLIVAEVNGEPIYLDDLQEVWEGMPENYRRQFPRGFQDLLEQWVRQYLLAQAARELGIDDEPAIRKKIENLTRQVLVQEYINREIIEQIRVSDQEIQDEYQANPALYTEPESRKVRHIMLDSEENADRAYQEIQEGKDFAEVAREWSVSPDADNGGVMGFIRRGDLGSDIEDIVFGLEPGSLSDVVKSDYGYHIFFVEESLDARIKSIDEVREEIAARLLPRIQQEKFEKIIEDLKNRAEIAIIEEHLPVETDMESGN